jgi:hypothetical protein
MGRLPSLVKTIPGGPWFRSVELVPESRTGRRVRETPGLELIEPNAYLPG